MKPDKQVLVELGLTPAETNELIKQAQGIDSFRPSAEIWQQVCRDMLGPERSFEVHHYFYTQVYSEKERAEGLAPGWLPDKRTIRASNIAWLMKASCRNDYSDLYRWSITDKAAFWETMVNRMEVRFKKTYTSVLDTSAGTEQARWLTGAELNIVDSCFSAPGDSAAIVYQAEGGVLQRMSVAELRSLVFRVANGLQELEIRTGTRIGICMPMTVEAVAVFLGVIASGYEVVTVADSFTPDEIGIRLQIADAELVFTQDYSLRLGKQLSLYEKLKEAKAPRTIVVPAGDSLGCELRPDDMAWDDFLPDEDSFTTVVREPGSYTTILFSSGTTGQPKAIPWDQTTPLKSAIDAHLHHDIHPGDVVCWPTNLGWMMGPWLVYSALMNKATFALYYGAPTTGEFGRFVQQAGVTMLGLVPSIVRAWKSTECMKGLDWSQIRAFSSSGECSNPHDMLYLMYLAGYKPIIEYCGGTELGGGYVAGIVIQPSIPATFSTAALGYEFVIADEKGQASEMGELYLVPPAMGQSQTLLNRDHHEVYYAGCPPGPKGQVLRRHGDQMQRLANGYFKAQGRVDDSMNLGGIKVSSLQIEEVTNKVAAVKETAAIAVSPPAGGPALLVIYAVPTEPSGVEAEALKADMQEAIRTMLNPLFKIHDVVITDTLPRTASNKVMRRLLRAEYEKKTLVIPSKD